VPPDTDQHALKTETLALLRWLRRRWWVVWLVLLAQSLIWSSQVRTANDWNALLLQRRVATSHRAINIVEHFSASRGGDEKFRTGGTICGLLWPEQRFSEALDRTTEEPNVPAKPNDGREVVVLLHGSPGSAGDFHTLATCLASAERRSIAIDLPGFGLSDRWPGGYSIQVHAAAALAFLDQRGVHRFHLVGWSMGGGAALHIVDMLGDRAQDRVASLTLMASLGVQEGEGSGSFYFEHFKYAVGYAGLVVAPELIPHFGLLGDRRDRNSFIRNFWDTDQRPLRAVMERVRVPTLVLHGKHDSLVPCWVAEESQSLIPASRLVKLDANHFLPFLQAKESARILEDHFARHDVPSVVPRTDVIDLAPERSARTLTTRILAATEPRLRASPWWLELAVIAVLALLFPVLTPVAAALLCSFQQLDLFLAGTGVALGWAAQGIGVWVIGRWSGGQARAPAFLGARLPHLSPCDWRGRFKDHPLRWGWSDHFVPARRTRAPLAAGMLRTLPPAFIVGRIAAIIACAAAAMIVPFVLFSLAASGGRDNPLMGSSTSAELAVIAGVLVATWAATRGLSRAGRQHIRAALTRLVRHEFWPMWLFYAPLYVYLVPLSIRHRGLMTPSCCNPGIENGGGLVGESKHSIMRALAGGAPEHARASVLSTHLIPGGESPQGRADRVDRFTSDGSLRYPAILKPDEGQRGHAVRLVRSGADARAYFDRMSRDAVLQPYHPGPCECGILWARTPRKENKAVSDPGQDRHDSGCRTGFIFSITRKEFPVIVGDGRRTLEELIDAHPRFRCQSEVYLQRFADHASRVLERGESMRLAVSGNHCQGTLFRDGADLITPELERAIDVLASGFPGPLGAAGGLDFGRFDVRYTSDDALRAGLGFSILELNGTFSESTNLYDPDRPIFWSYGILFRQWRLMYELGAERRSDGGIPMTARALISAAREHFAARDGSAVAD